MNDTTDQNPQNATNVAYEATDVVGEVFPPKSWISPATPEAEEALAHIKQLTVEQFCEQSRYWLSPPTTFDVKKFVDQWNAWNAWNAGQTNAMDCSEPTDDQIRSQVTGLDEPMSHSKDVELLESQVQRVMNWHNDKNEQAKYLAPVLPVVQSSGTGKTRLLYELRQLLKGKGVHCVSILCLGASDKLPSNWGDYYDGYHIFGLSTNNEEGRDVLRAKVIEVCGKVVNTKPPPNNDKLFDVVLLLDESQHLLVCDPPGYLFRVVRWMSREVPQNRPTREGWFRRAKLTVVPTGTNSALADYYPDPENTPKATNTRFLQSGNLGYLNADKQNAVPYDPFNWLRTMGCIAAKQGDEFVSERNTEYERCIPYGRPLFEIMYRKKLLDQFESTALDKVMLGKNIDDNDDKNKASIISVLGTRVQMGTTNSAVVSELVSRGYAHLTGFHRQNRREGGATHTASFAFLPDPVCARLAMRLMDDEAQLERAQHETTGTAKSGNSIAVKGKKKSWWAGKISDIFRTKLCRLDKGDFGEVAVALYLLFCGDELRKKEDGEYKTFSVALSNWLSQLKDSAVAVDDGEGDTKEAVNDNNLGANTDDDDDLGSNTDDDGDPSDDDVSMVDENAPTSTCTINCIQFYRHSLRIDFKKYHSQQFLGWLYKAACGIYGPVNVAAFDQLLPIKCLTGAKTEYLPCYVSTKNYAYAAPSSARGWQIASIGALVDAGVTRGLFLLVIVGQDTISENYENVLGEDDTNDLTMFRIPKPKKESRKNKKKREHLNALLRKVLSADVSKVHKHLVPKMLCIGEGDDFEIHQAIKKAHPSNDKFSDVYECHSSFLSDNDNIYSNVSGLPTDAVTFMNATRGALQAPGSS